MDGSEGAAGRGECGTERAAEEVRVGYAAFYAVCGRHRPEETDRVRLFRLIKQPASSWLVKSDIVDLVWAVSETHSGLDFLRDSAGEFLEAYVRTTALRIMWTLSASGTGKITLQRWRHSAITEVRLDRVPRTPAPSLPRSVGTPLFATSQTSRRVGSPPSTSLQLAIRSQVLFELDEEADINLARDYFSYNHFYVIWCVPALCCCSTL